ncbi:hypothetical protein LIER_26912 [Lithospermum erythrorhizon]|uniref:Uncharacterized protein n=1 Tax=Lithospermum erythrorhizon TaxID=34254 RepID=A0AAV3RA35_LITER
MASQAKGEDAQPASDSQQAASSSTSGWGRTLVEQYSRIKENAETYPYVWGSYVLVYGGFGLWLTYRWRRLRNTEDRVRVLQERLQKLLEDETSAGTTVADKVPKDAIKPKE